MDCFIYTYNGVEYSRSAMEAKLLEEYLAEKSNVVAITKEAMAPERIELGLTDNDKLFISSSDKDVSKKVKSDIAKNPNLPKERVDAILFGEGMHENDPLILVYEKARLKVEMADVNKEIKKYQEAGDQLNVLNSSLKKDVIEQQQQDVLQALDLIGSKFGKGLRGMQFIIDDNYDYASIKRSIEDSQGEPLTKEQEAKFKKVAEDYQKLKDKLAEMEASQEEYKSKVEKEAFDKIKEELKKQKESTTNRTEAAKRIANNIRRLKTKPIILVDENGNVIDLKTHGATFNDVVEAVAKIVEKGGEIADAIHEAIKDAKWYTNLSEAGKKKVEQQLNDHFSESKDLSYSELEKVAKEKADGELHVGMKATINRMVKALVKEDITIDINKVVDKIYDSLKGDIPDLSKSDLRDMISGYGKYTELSKDQVDRAIAELKLQGRNDAALEAVKIKNELPLRSGRERAKKSQETRLKQAEILKTIKEKGLVPNLTDEDIARQYKSAEEAYQTRLDNAIKDIEKEIETNKLREKSQPKEYTSARTLELKEDLKRLKAIREEKFSVKENAKIKATEKAIEDVEKEIEVLKNGGVPEGEPKVGSKGGKPIFKFSTQKPRAEVTERIKELQSLKDALNEERSNLIPEELKKQALIEKNKKNRQRRLDTLQKQVDENNYSSKPKPKPLPTDEKVREINREIKKLEFIIAEEKAKIKLEEAKDLARVTNSLSRWQRFSAFASIRGIARLSLAALYRPLEKPTSEAAKLLLSNLPFTKEIMKKSVSNYAPNLQSVKKSMIDYYVGLTSKETLNNALSEYKKYSNWELEHGTPSTNLGPQTTLGKIAEMPQKTHGFLKSGPKYAELKSAYERTLSNMATEVNPDTGEFYDITNPDVQQKAMKIAEINALTAIFMQNSEMSKMIRGMIEGGQKSDNAFLQSLALYLSVQMPVVKIPQNFYLEVLRKTPLVGSLEAIRRIWTAGEEHTKRKDQGGVKALTQEQAQKVSEILVNQVIGTTLFAVGVAMYKKYGDDALDKMDKAKYWMHNTGFKILMLGMQSEKEAKDKNENLLEASAKETAASVKEGAVETPQARAVIDIARIIKSKEYSGLSKKAQEMLATILVPQGAADVAKWIDDEQKRYPETFKELVEARIPGLRGLVPLKQPKQGKAFNPDKEYEPPTEKKIKGLQDK